MLRGKVLITGGGGFMGRGLLHAAERDGWDCEFVVVSRDSQKHDLVKRKYPDTRTAVCDILDLSRLTALMTGCDYVIHAAALKHLPECEAQPSQALRVNVDGTRSVMAAAEQSRVKRVVCISTDKAAAPMNTYGMTKALVERLVFESLDVPYGETEFSAVRYGNMIGSTGSIWPVWKRQAEHGPISVTDPSMTRFFISVDEAIEVILEAFRSDPGVVLVPQPQALNIGELANYVCERWGVAQNVIGLRPGEKSHEAMLSMAELSQVRQLQSGLFALHGPMVKLDQPDEMLGVTSDEADTLDPEDFVLAAEESEQI